ncbi:hypothetical protein GCM10010277_76820 [Streptomyces longisporoflavus]|uniref:hypothetical protein n=1 Tax=Streptomyces longisporoflavus TaxID=28044 RepID=UPI00167C8BE2|nr:hypothetical protein [Streptomyces longisporoflavus]GGV67852.1 hypothetical protein GCM10010277_76820 [Streptomyces longisporoflavus]
MTINARGTTADPAGQTEPAGQTDPAGQAQPAGQAEVFRGQGRTAQRIADSVAILTPALLFVVPVLLVRARLIDDGFLFLNLVSLIISALVASYAPMGWRARLHGDDLLSARTLTGRRTVDLARLTKVGRLEVPGQTRTDDRLILTDAHGVRLILDKLAGSDQTVDALVLRALRRRPPGAGVVVSDRAAERLDLRTEVRRPHGRLKPGRAIREGLIGWVPLLGLLVIAPVGFGLLAAGLTLSGVI